MKKCFILRLAVAFVILLMSGNSLLAQAQTQNASLTNIDPTQPAFSASNFGGESSSPYMYTIIGVRNMSAAGNTKFATDWLSGNVLFKSGKQIPDAELEFDVSKNELHFRQNNKAYLYAEPVKEFSLFAILKNDVRTFRFKSGYPEFGRQNANTFYLVMATGIRYELLKHLFTQVNEVFQYSSSIDRTVKIMEDWYIYDNANNKLILLPSKNAQSIKKVLPQYESTIEKVISVKKDKHWTEQEMIALIDELNK
jgi:hypothetical protein